MSDVFDIAQFFNFGVAGIATGKGFRRGVQERTTFEEFLEQRGMKPGIARTIAGLALDIGLDPTTYFGIGTVARGIRAVPGGARVLQSVARGGKAAAARVGLAFTPTQEAALRVVDEALRQQGVAAEETQSLVRGIRQSADQLAQGNRARSQLYRKALGGYFDVGADEMMRVIGHLEDTPVGSTFGGRVSAARPAALRAQQEYLAALPQDVRAYVERWVPVVREAEENMLDNLVRVGRITPDTAEKWRGFHLRPFYARFGDPEQFVEFLRANDPARAVELLSQMEHVPRRLRVSGQGIPGEVGKARTLLSTERGALGEVAEADARIAASHPVYQKAIAQGEMLQTLARDYARPELEQLITLPGADRLYRRMPPTEKWGALAGKVVPKEVHDLLLSQFADPTRWEKYIGYWKALKTVDNPATHGRNIRSMLTQQVPAAIGLRAFDPSVWVKAIRELTTNGPLFQEAKQVASWAVNTYTARELPKIAREVNRAKTLTDHFIAPLRVYHTKMARAYQFEDMVGRMAIYSVLRGRGVGAQAAAMAADKGMINYRRVPPSIDFLRRKAFYPFISFPYGVITQVIPMALQRPGQSLAGLKAVRAFTEPFTEEEQRALPRYMRTGGFVKLGDRVLALLPWLRDPQGRPVAYDLTYELLWGDIAEQGTPLPAIVKILSGRASQLEARDLLPALTPFGQLVAEVSMNYSSFIGAPIQRPEEPALKRGIFAARALLPGGAFDVAETIAAGTGVLERAGITPVSEFTRSVMGIPTAVGKRPPSVPAAATRAFAGVRTVPIEVPVERRQRMLELRGRLATIESRISSTTRNQALSSELKRRRIAELLRQRAEILRTFQQEGAVPEVFLGR